MNLESIRAIRGQDLSDHETTVHTDEHGYFSSYPCLSVCIRGSHFRLFFA